MTPFATYIAEGLGERNMMVRAMKNEDLETAALVHQQAFPRQHNSLQWLQCNLHAAPRLLSYVAVENEQVIGYIIWNQKSGFRSQVILELEQLAVAASWQRQGIAHQLIQQSLIQVKQHLINNAARLKHIIVTTRADNAAQQLYRNTLGAEIECTITDLYSADEVLMIARNVDI